MQSFDFCTTVVIAGITEIHWQWTFSRELRPIAQFRETTKESPTSSNSFQTLHTLDSKRRSRCKRLKVSLHCTSVTKHYTVSHDSLYSNLHFIAILKHLLIHHKKSVKYLAKELHHTDA